MSEKLKILDDIVEQVPVLKKAYNDTIDENERLSQAIQKLELQLKISKISAQKEKEAKQKLINNFEIKTRLSILWFSKNSFLA